MNITSHSLINTTKASKVKGAYVSKPSNASFRGMPKVTEAVEIFGKEVGSSAGEHLNKTIEKVLKAENTGVKKLEDGSLQFAEDSFGKKLYRAIADPLIYLPLDLANSTLNLFKKIPGLKNAKFIDKLLAKAPLKNRSENLENLSNTMAIKHCFEMLGGERKDKDKILRESLKRFKVGQTEYTVKGERSLTRLVSGIIPAFFLANDAYNLSMYVNNNKDLAKKEKKRRFYQEVARVTVTAAATFATLGFFSKKVSSNPAAATGIIAALTFGSELIGRMLVGTPVYPIDKSGAKKYAKLQHKDKLNQNKDDKNVDLSKSDNKKDKSKSNYVLKLLGGMILAGFLIDKRNSIKPVRKFLNKLSSQYKEFFAKDYKIKKTDFDRIIAKLKENKDFEPIAERYETLREKIIEDGNLTTKELFKVEREMDNRVEQSISDIIILNEDKLKDRQKEIRKEINKKRGEIIKSFNFTQKSDDIIHISGDLKDFFKERTNVDKTKDNIINGFLALPIKFIWEILNMPYQYVVKPLIEIPLNGKELLAKNEKELNCKEVFRKSVEYLHKNIDASDFKEKVNKNIMDGFDNVNKSNISSADLAGSAKIAVSTVTSGFLILDNYNMVMIDSEGKDKKLAKQKAKERTIQRIVRIAYGAALIKLFNGLFKSQFDASLLGAEAVTAGSVLVTETLERTSVGMPLQEATKDEIIQKDNENLSSRGLKGIYFRFMSKLTGKKPISEKKVDK